MTSIVALCTLGHRSSDIPQFLRISKNQIRHLIFFHVRAATMASQRPIPSLALLRSLRLSSPAHHRHLIKAIALSNRRAFTSTPWRLDTPQDPPQSFRSQLYESTAQRIQRQRKAEREQELMTTGGGLGRVAWTFSVTASQCPSSSSYASAPITTNADSILQPS